MGFKPTTHHIRPGDSPRPRAGVCLPYARGDLPLARDTFRGLPESTPRIWGSTRACDDVLHRYRVCPTHVGIYLTMCTSCARRDGLLHARGGLPKRFAYLMGKYVSAPHAWGSTRQHSVFAG